MQKFRPTHEITFQPSNGPAQTVAVMLIDGAAYTREEWDSASNADWEHDTETGWTFQGKTAPGNGEVTVRKV